MPETTPSGTTDVEAAHTPGPWSVRDNENGTLGIDAKEPDGTYCQPARINGNADDRVYGPVTRANAQLIAAAPELLEACKILTKVFSNLAVKSGLRGDSMLYFPDAGIKCQVGDIVTAGADAIAKATRE